MRFLSFFVVGVLAVASGCNQDNSSAITWSSLEELERNHEKFRGYNIAVGPTIDGPYAVVRGVNFTVRREGMDLFHRELDYQGKRWVFKHENSAGRGFRFVSVGNQKGESCPILLVTEELVEAPTSVTPSFGNAGKGKGDRKRNDESADEGGNMSADEESGDDDESDDADKSGDDAAGEGDKSGDDASKTESGEGGTEGEPDSSAGGDDGDGAEPPADAPPRQEDPPKKDGDDGRGSP
jgi:hypothetical protein